MRIKGIITIISLLVISISCKKDEEPVDNLNSLPESDRVFYMLNNNQEMKWSTDGETWTDIYKIFNRTKNTPNQAQFKTDGVRVYAYVGANLYDAEKGAFYQVLSLGINPSNEVTLAVTKNASHLFDATQARILSVPHGAISFNTFPLTSAGINSSQVVAFLSNSVVVFAYISDGDVLFSDDHGTSWKQGTATSTNVNMGVFDEIKAWGEDFYAFDGDGLYTSNNATTWNKINYEFNVTSSSTDTLVSLDLHDVFADENYINFTISETVSISGENDRKRNVLLESNDKGQTWTEQEIDITGQTDGLILKIENIYVTEIESNQKEERSIHYSEDLENWTAIAGSQMYMSNVYQLYKVQTVDKAQ